MTLRSGVALWTLLVFAALLKNARAECDKNCTEVELTTTNTTVSVGSEVQCTLSTHNNISGNGSITGLTPGAVYQISFSCLNCCKEVTTMPGKVNNPVVTDFTTSSISLSWTKPEGNSSSYKVQWTDGTGTNNASVTETHINIPDLTPGVQYTIYVTAVADDRHTEGPSVTVSKYTKPEKVNNLQVIDFTTSSISLNWTKPEGNSSFYRVQWTDGNVTSSNDVTQTYINIINLTAGVQYTITVAAVADNRVTEGASDMVLQWTKPEVVRNLTVHKITTSSISLNWTEPNGFSSVYRVRWTDGTETHDANVTQTYINITNLTAGVQYTITVGAVADDQTTEGASVTVSRYTKPEVVKNLTVTKITMSSISLNWTKPEGNSSFYRVQWTGGDINYSVNVSETFKVITNLTAGAQYNISVTAVAHDGHTDGQSTAVSKYTKPEKVNNLQVTEFTTSSISLNWTKPEGNSSFYRVQWTDGNVTSSNDVTQTYINIINLTAGVQYTITMTAVADDHLTEGASVNLSQYTKPEVVRNLTVTEFTTSSISLNWTKPEGNSSFYRVQWTDGNVTESGNTNETYINLTKLTAGVQYEMSVTAVADDQTTEGASVTVSWYTKPEVVKNLTVTKITTSSISLNWTKPEGNSSFYRVQWTGGDINYSVNVSETFKVITNLTAGAQYNISVTAVAHDGHTDGQSTAVSKYTKPEKVNNLQVTEFTTSSISLNWTKPEGNSSFYRVQWTDGNVTSSNDVTQTYINLTNLTAGVQYEMSVTAVADDHTTEGASVTVSQYTKPEVVKNLTVTKVTTSSISLNWTKPEGNSSFYRVQWTGGDINYSVNVSETFKVITNLTAGAQYNISVTAVAHDGHTDGQSTAVSQYTKPGKIENLDTSTNATFVSLSWTKPPGQVFDYQVEWDNGGTPMSTFTSGDTFVVLSELTPGTTYMITITAVAGDNKTKGDGETVTLITKPEVVRNLSVTEFTTSSVSLKWTEPEGNSSFYIVQWTGENLQQNRSMNNTYITISELTAGVQYSFAVRAVAGDKNNIGEEETVSQYTKPEVARDLTVINYTTSSISLNWTEPEGNSSFYRVQWTDGDKNYSVNVSETFKVITNLTAGAQYNISVTAVAGDGHTDGQNSIVSQYTKPEKIENPTTFSDTTSIKLTWTKPPGQVFDYKVEWSNNGKQMIRFTSNSTSAVLSDLTPGTNYTITVTAVAGDNRTTGEPYTFTSITKPAAVMNLMVTEVTTSSVSLNWTKPEGNVDHYSILWSTGGNNLTDTSTETSFTIRDLLPGFQYDITVAAVAGSNKGEGASAKTFTRPDKPENLTATPGTDILIISWTLPKGRVDHYVVNISNTDLMYSNSTQAAGTTASFTDLHPGRIFAITVTAVAGDFDSMSDSSSFATVPTPPGSISINQPTNSSLHVEWTAPARMEETPNISYHITYRGNGGEIQRKNSTGTNTELSLLLSGTSYNVTVETVGPQNLRSSVVHNSHFTLPNPVLSLEARPKSTTSVTVEWADPVGVQLYYNYLVRTYSETGALVNSRNATNNSADVTDLEPGTRYNISVTTIAAPGSESAVEETFIYTMPKAVTDLTVDVVNTTAIRLTWLRQSDHKPSYSYLVVLQDGVEVSTTDETYTFSSLVSGSLYTFTVYAVVAGVRSTPQTTQGHTVPDPVSSLTAIGSTTNLSVSWTPGSGQVSSYSVWLHRDSQLVRNFTDLNNETRNVLFLDLQPGVLYSVKLDTKSGPATSTSSVSNATFPNPPGPITVESQTVNTIKFTWSLPEDMDHNQYNFSVSNADFSTLVQNNWFLLSKLSSGSPYNISVVTVGVLYYESIAVTAENYTRPFPVTNLRAATVSTDSVLLKWDQPERRSDYTWLVQVSNGVSRIISEAGSELSTTISELQSGSNFSFTVTTRTADGTEADPVTESYFTRPLRVTELEASAISSTAVKVTWMKPPDYKHYYTYQVRTPCLSKLTTSTTETAEISDLIPGSRCMFCVSVLANGIQGNEDCVAEYTHPVAAQPSISNQGSNSSVKVSWTKPPGTVEGYVVTVSSPSGFLHKSELLSSFVTSYLLQGLSAGTVYTASLKTTSGTYIVTSSTVTTATFPNSPGPIVIENKTTSSIEFSWGEAPQMSGASFHYEVTIRPSQGVGNITTNFINSTSHTFASLPSGTSFNISVLTVGVLNLKSSRVYSDMVTTRPLSVHSLRATPGQVQIAVTWTEPNDYKESYRYILKWQRSDRNNSNDTILQKTNFIIDPLDPGSHYYIDVTTVTSDGTTGAPTWTSSCTKASPVIDLTCEGPNKANAELILDWTKPYGQNSGFRITVNERQIIHTNGICCNHTIPNLIHNTEYSLTVETLSCGEPSDGVKISCKTGITDPPIPDTCDSLAGKENVKHNMFSIKIHRSKLNESNGPITHIGVLVKESASGDTSNLTQYLGITYNEWKAGKTSVYLATAHSITQLQNNQDLIVIGDGTHWSGYTNGALKAKGKYQYAIAVFTSWIMNEHLVDANTSLVSITDFCSSVELPVDPAVIGIAVGATLGVFFVLLIILIGFIIYWRRLAKKESSDIQIHSMRSKVSVPVRVEDYEAYYKKQKADSNCGFAEEFEDLKIVGTGQAKTHALTLENKPKNRYNNVLPYDSSRVKLSIIHGSPFDDYINANYMPGFLSKKEFIAAQGPLPATVNEFWRMIWEKNVQTLVMLTRCNEQGRVKCEQYWGSGTKHFQNITVNTTSEIPLEDWTIRDFDIKNVKTAETRSIRHFHFTAWPDHGVPETTELLISFRHLVREHMNQYSRNSPTVVHCSAGVGRTGTFIAIDRLIFQIERENIVDVFGIVHDLRMHRPLMVQTEDQYVFLNQCALDVIRSRTGTNVDLIYQNTAALSIYENVEPKKGYSKE